MSVMGFVLEPDFGRFALNGGKLSERFGQVSIYVAKGLAFNKTQI